jgi:hypothetical protein
MKVSVADYERAVRTTEERLARERREVGAADPPQQGKGTLADRVRALQTTASRISN